MGHERVRRLGLGTHQRLTRGLNSDAHTLQALGRKASGDRRVTRFKMNALSFESLRIALDDAGHAFGLRTRFRLPCPSSEASGCPADFSTVNASILGRISTASLAAEAPENRRRLKPSVA